MSVGWFRGGSGLQNKLSWAKNRRFLWIALVLAAILAVAVFFGIRRPHIIATADGDGIYVKNVGETAGRISRVNLFWYWESQVGYIVDLPPVSQTVPPGRDSQLPIAPLPGPGSVVEGTGPFFMRMVVHYQMPGIPVFRYRSVLYFRHDPRDQKWVVVAEIPAKYRSLGSMGRGNVEMIKLNEKNRLLDKNSLRLD